MSLVAWLVMDTVLGALVLGAAAVLLWRVTRLMPLLGRLESLVERADRLEARIKDLQGVLQRIRERSPGSIVASGLRFLDALTEPEDRK